MRISQWQNRPKFGPPAGPAVAVNPPKADILGKVLMAAAIRRVVRFFLGAPWPEVAPKCVRSDFLFVQPSGLHGMARTFDLAGQYDVYNFSLTGPQADANALFADFAVIGQDLQFVIDDAGREYLADVGAATPLNAAAPPPLHSGAVRAQQAK